MVIQVREWQARKRRGRCMGEGEFGMGGAEGGRGDFKGKGKKGRQG